ncbi:MAG TPA: glycosyltransferase [Candidatus Saccharimonadales bacterium]|nr:glycosyltransferase [Candidatus Saccharimonadales bacterium]
MLKTVELTKRRFDDYRGQVSDALFDEVRQLAAPLKGARVLQINATDGGGGVAEILRSTVPLLRDLGLEAEWQVLVPRPGFFTITKMIHNGLQGDPKNLKPEQWQDYEDYNRQLAGYIDPAKWDFIIIHDPQPAAVLGYVTGRVQCRWVWRCHIDSHHANPHYRHHLLEYLRPYDGAIYTLEKYVLEGHKPRHLAITPMAIDPLAAKNQPMDPVVAAAIVRQFGLNPDQPLAVQVSRFDPWKDPLGVIAAWKLAKRHVPDLQLALVGEQAPDDPEGEVILAQVRQVAQGERNLFIVAGQADDRAVQAFQAAADVVVQKSLREGFGLTVTEALWSGTPVVGSDVGGIPLQVIDGQTGYTTGGIQDTAERLVELIQNPQLAQAMGQRGRELVRQKFLTPRLLRDDLRFMVEVGGR